MKKPGTTTDDKIKKIDWPTNKKRKGRDILDSAKAGTKCGSFLKKKKKKSSEDQEIQKCSV